MGNNHYSTKVQLLFIGYSVFIWEMEMEFFPYWWQMLESNFILQQSPWELWDLRCMSSKGTWAARKALPCTLNRYIDFCVCRGRAIRSSNAGREWGGFTQWHCIATCVQKNDFPSTLLNRVFLLYKATRWWKFYLTEHAFSIIVCNLYPPVGCYNFD